MLKKNYFLLSFDFINSFRVYNLTHKIIIIEFYCKILQNLRKVFIKQKTKHFNIIVLFLIVISISFNNHIN